MSETRRYKTSSQLAHLQSGKVRNFQITRLRPKKKLILFWGNKKTRNDLMQLWDQFLIFSGTTTKNITPAKCKQSNSINK